MTGEDYCNQFHSVFFLSCISVCTPFYPFNSKTIVSIEFKFGGEILHRVHTHSSKFGEIEKNKFRRYILFTITHIHRNLLLFLKHENQYFAF